MRRLATVGKARTRQETHACPNHAQSEILDPTVERRQPTRWVTARLVYLPINRFLPMTTQVMIGGGNGMCTGSEPAARPHHGVTANITMR